MADPLVLYVVAAVVIAGLLIWVAVVLATAPPAVDAAMTMPPADTARRVAPTTSQVSEPRVVEAPAEEEAAVVVNLPPMRSRLDSHPEIRDEPRGEPSVIVMSDEAPESGGPPLVLVSAVGATDPSALGGRDHAFSVVDRHHLFVLADGAGHAHGGAASRLVVEAIAAAFDADDTSAVPDDPELSPRGNRLRRAIRLANRKVMRRAADPAVGEGLRTRVLAVHFAPNNARVFIGQVGQTRCWLVRDNVISTPTREFGPGVGDEAQKRVVGVTDAIDVHVTEQGAQAGDVYVCCSSRLAAVLTAADLLPCLSSPTLEAATTAIVDAAKAKGCDDLTVILVRVDARRPS